MSSIQSMITEITELGDTDRSVDQLRLIDSISRYCTSIRAGVTRDKRETKKAMDFVRNTMQGLEYGVTNNVVSASDMRSIVTTCLSKIAKASSVDNEDADVVTVVKSQPKKSLSWAEGLQAYKDQQEESVPTRQEPVVDDSAIKGAKAIFSTLREDMSQVPVSIKRIAALSQAPIIPIFSDYHIGLPKNLERLGVSVLQLDSYPILLDQYILIIDTKKLEERVNPDNIAKKRLSKETLIRHTHKLLDMINLKSGVKYAMASEFPVPNPGNSTLICFWLLTSEQRVILDSLVPGNGPKVDRWGFPF